MALQNGGGDSPEGKWEVCECMSKSGVEHSPGVTAVLFLPTTSFCCVNKKTHEIQQVMGPDRC